MNLRTISKNIRKEIIELYWIAEGGHFGGSLSIVEILSTLYFKVLHIDPNNPKWDNRDRLILSKGHACGALCVILSQRGFFPKEKLKNFNKLDSLFGVHPDMHKIPGVDMSTGSLGHGLPVAIGMALGARVCKKNFRVFVIAGDGELNEGSMWEAIAAANHYKLDNLTLIIDRNGLSMDGDTEKIMSLEPLEEKFKSFNWCARVINGHDLEALSVLDKVPFKKNKPSCLICKTIKGKGISFMEGNPEWHYGGLNEDKFKKALMEIEGEI